MIHAVAAVRRGTKEDRIGGAPGDALGQALRYLASDTLACFGIAQSSQHFLATSVVHPVGKANPERGLRGSVGIEIGEDGNAFGARLLEALLHGPEQIADSLCRSLSHPAQYVSGIPSPVILLSISHPIRCSTRCLANVRARISGPMIAL